MAGFFPIYRKMDLSCGTDFSVKMVQQKQDCKIFAHKIIE